MPDTTLSQRHLGADGFPVSEIGLGCWQIGGDWGHTASDEAAFEILQTAIDAGVTFLDTADVYGGGRSERLIGEFLKTLNGPRPYVATKFGRAANVFPDGYSKDNMRRGLESSLSRLGVDRLDLVQLHCIPTEYLRRDDVFDWLREFKEEGLISHFGASVETVEEGLLAMRQSGLQSLQVIFNIFRQKIVTELLPQAVQTDTGIIVRLPLASGLLSGKFTKQSTFTENDHRNYNRDGQAFNVGETFAGLPFDKGVELVDGLKDKLPEGMSLSQMALRWILDHPAVSTIIPGASRPDQITGNVAAAALPPLEAALHKELEDYYASKVAPHIRGPY